MSNASSAPQPPVTVGLTSWAGPAAPTFQAESLEALEQGRVVQAPRLSFVLTAEEGVLYDAALVGGRRKNISFDPTTGAVSGTTATDAQHACLAGMMGRFAQNATALVHALVPRYAHALRIGRTSFRPAEIAGRKSSVLKDDARLHVDAFPSRPLAGLRVLRVFANVNPAGVPRQWAVGETFESFASRFLPRVAVYRGWKASALAALGVTKGRRTAYDHVMLGLHDAAKRDEVYQRSAPKCAIAFPAGSTWICFSDQVVHAASAGQFALEQTFYLPVAAMAAADAAPLACLERMMGRRLV